MYKLLTKKQYRETSVDILLCVVVVIFIIMSLSFFFLALKQILYEFYINEDHVVYEEKFFERYIVQQKVQVCCVLIM